MSFTILLGIKDEWLLKQCSLFHVYKYGTNFSITQWFLLLMMLQY